jgi:hypothetical protein
MTRVEVVIVKIAGWRVILEWGSILPSPVPVVSQTRTYWPLEKDMPVSPAVIPTGQFSAHLVLFWATKMVGQPARDPRILCADV